MNSWNDKVIKIRKAHRCFACLTVFPSGSTMRTQTNDYDGISTIYTCSDCDSLLNDFHDQFYDDFENLYPGGCVREAMQEHKVATPNELRPLFTKAE